MLDGDPVMDNVVEDGDLLGGDGADNAWGADINPAPDQQSHLVADRGVVNLALEEDLEGVLALGVENTRINPVGNELAEIFDGHPGALDA